MAVVTPLMGREGVVATAEQDGSLPPAPVKVIAVTVKAHLWGIINAVFNRTTNAIGESLNARIQKIKAMACGFRNRARFRRAILFHLGGLDLMTVGASSSTHTKA